MRKVSEQTIHHQLPQELVPSRGFTFLSMFFDGHFLRAEWLCDLQLPPEARRSHRLKFTGQSKHVLGWCPWANLPFDPKQHHIFIEHHGYAGRRAEGSTVCFSIHLVCGWDTIWRQSFRLTKGTRLLLTERVIKTTLGRERQTVIQTSVY